MYAENIVTMVKPCFEDEKNIINGHLVSKTVLLIVSAVVAKQGFASQ